jgi:gluconate 5-dehydrogenase
MRLKTFETVRRTSTDYVVGPDSINKIDSSLADKAYVVITDKIAAELHPHKIARLTSQPRLLGTLSLPGGEAIKCFKYLETVIEFFEQCNLPKRAVVVAVGGGTLCDVVALATMLMRRGLELLLVPTTLLAQIDAAVGGKNAINLGLSKNLIGGFHQPSLVCCDQDFLLTLASRQIICGMAEAIKVTAVCDAHIFSRYFSDPPRLTELSAAQDWTDLIWDAIKCKLALLEEDVYEQSSRRLLNYGHTSGHLLEELSAYELTHGEAVLVGMIIENELSRELAIGSKLDIDHLNSVIGSYLTQDCSRHCLDFDEMASAFSRLQEARCGTMNYVCVVTPGRAVIVPEVTLQQIRAAWAAGASLRRRPNMFTSGRTPFSLEGRVALITGASRGLGRAMAEGLSDAGATVLLNGRDAKSLEIAVDDLRRRGLKADAIPFDVSDRPAVRAAVELIIQRYERLDILISNAGAQHAAALDSWERAEWDRLIDVNLSACFFLAQEVSVPMRRRRYGRIIFTTSIANILGRATIHGYTAAKSGLAGITRSLAAELGEYGITCNSISPGYFETEMTRELWSDAAFMSRITSRIPLARWGQPHDVASAAVFLASDAASYVTAHELVVDGGFTATM